MELKFSPCIPSYDGGKLANGIYNAGPMTAHDLKDFTNEDCPMLLVTETNESEFNAYIKKLRDAGFETVYENHNGAYDAFQMKNSDGVLVYVYFTKLIGEVRIMEDRAGCTVPEFEYECEGDGCEIYQYGLYYDPKNGHSPTTTNCGMFYIVKLADNSLFMIDGGHLFQCSEEAVEGMYKFVHKITGTADDEPIRISCWYFTHGHDDHMSACIRLLRSFPEKFEIDRVMFNFPSWKKRPGNHEIFVLKEALREFCPDAKMLKVQSGQTFRLGSVKLEVLYTQQDAVIPGESVTDEMFEENKWLDRDNPTYGFRDYNCTSPIIKMYTKNGTVMWLGDTNLETEALVTRTVPHEMFKADVVQVAHHCFNFLRTLYPLIDADYAMLPNTCYGGHSGNNKDKLQDVIDHLADPNNIWYEEKTTGFVFDGDGKYRVILEEPFAGKDHDGIGFYGEYLSFEDYEKFCRGGYFN